jgi:hypothetical protein
VAETPDPLAAELAKWQALTDAATKCPWSITEQHGRDIADEEWSDVRITGPAGEQIMLAYLTGILEPGSPSEDADPDFVIAARSFVPRLLAAVEAVRTIACGWTAEAKDVPMIARDLAADVVTRILARELLSEEGSDGA